MELRIKLHEVIDRLQDDQLKEALEIIEGLLQTDADPVLERLRQMPGIRVPANWPSPFEEVTPIKIEGELASEQLIRERR